ncbi:MAG: hypothetical protein P8Z40_04275 [Chloroflexota bacterium]
MSDPRSIRPLSPDYEQPGTDVTLHSLQRVDNATLARLSALTLPEVEQLKQEIANILPAGNLPGLILAGLTNLSERRVSTKRAESDVSTLFNGANLLPRGLYSLLIAGPAVVLSAYQQLLTLAGKDIDSAFPEGTWQFYLHFGLREDTGRHTNETVAYQRDRPRQATVEDDITAWIMSSVYTLFDNDTLNGVIWTEWTTLRIIYEAAVQSGVADKPPFAGMLKRWQAIRPYHTPPGGSYAEARQEAFDRFIQNYTEQLTEEALNTLRETLSTSADKVAYQQQMSLLARLEPERFRDERIRVPIWDAKIGLVWRDHYYLFDVCQKDERGRPLAFTVEGEQWPVLPDADSQVRDPYGKPLGVRGGWLYRLDETGQPAHPAAYLAPVDPAAVKGQVGQLLGDEQPSGGVEVTRYLVGAPRNEQTRLRELLPGPTQDAIKALSNALIILNWDEQDRSQPLGTIRRGALRGVGDHPLTIMHTADSMIFDQSHIFFDGLWGMALSEVMTNQAVEWCRHVADLPPGEGTIASGHLTLRSSVAFEASAIAQHFGTQAAESGAENTQADLALIDEAREWLRQRGVRLTVNDFLLLARIMHAANNQVDGALAAEVARLPKALRSKVDESLAASSGVNPAILIPVRRDAGGDQVDYDARGELQHGHAAHAGAPALVDAAFARPDPPAGGRAQRGGEGRGGLLERRAGGGGVVADPLHEREGRRAGEDAGLGRAHRRRGHDAPQPARLPPARQRAPTGGLRIAGPPPGAGLHRQLRADAERHRRDADADGAGRGRDALELKPIRKFAPLISDRYHAADSR